MLNPKIFAWFGWKFRDSYFLNIINVNNNSYLSKMQTIRWYIVFYEANRDGFWHGACTLVVLFCFDLVRQCHQVCVNSENFAWFGWKFLYLCIYFGIFRRKIADDCVLWSGSGWFLAWCINISHMHVTWCDRNIGYAIFLQFLRYSGVFFGIYGFLKNFCRGKIDDRSFYEADRGGFWHAACT